MLKAGLLVFSLLSRALCMRHGALGKGSLAAAAGSDTPPSCLDGTGDPVDFWYAFKAPDGWTFDYLDANDRVLRKQESAMNDEASAVSRTIGQVYASASSLSYAMWNDHPPGDKDAVGGAHAHAKGVLGYDGNSGFWVLHSVPLFPMPVDGPTHSPYEQASNKYGQSFLCITFAASSLETINALMASSWPKPYSAADNAGAGEAFSAWASEGASQDKAAPETVNVDVESKAGQVFKAFATRGSWDKDIYEDLISPAFGVDLFTETWQNGVGKLPDYKKGRGGKTYSVTNIDKVTLKDAGSWDSTQDHSKWAVSSDHQVFCVADKNRQHGQRKRGGGAICIKDAQIGEQMASVIAGTEDSGL